MKKHLIVLSTAIVSTVLLIIENIWPIGPWVNTYYPCYQDPLTSFACHAAYDIFYSLILIGVILLSLLILLFFYIQNKIREKSKKFHEKQDSPTSH